MEEITIVVADDHPLFRQGLYIRFPLSLVSKLLDKQRMVQKDYGKKNHVTSILLKFAVEDMQAVVYAFNKDG